MPKKSWTPLLALACSISVGACYASNTTQSQTANDTFVLSSSEMANGANLAISYSCDGDRISPALQWRGAPERTKSYALIMHHNAPDGVHWYWTMYNIDANASGVNDAQVLGKLGTNSVNGLNEYAPPCSKGPGKKDYTFTVYALSAPVNFNNDQKVDRSALLAAMKDITLDSATMTLSYQRANNATKQQLKQKPQSLPTLPKSATSHIDSPRCDIVKGSINDAGFAGSVAVTCDTNYAYIASSTYPDHQVMSGITGTNEQIAVPAIGYIAPIKLNPKKAEKLTTIDAAVGIAVNGVPIYDYSSQGELDVSQYDAKHDTLALGQLDNCGGHAGRGDDYHYHVKPNCMINSMPNQTSDAIIGWAYDGYPLFADHNPDGSDIGTDTLDVCNGQADATFGYRYHTSSTPPYIIQCLVGEVDTSILPRVAPLSGDSKQIRADLRPPKEGVKNLTHTMAEDGSRTMRYSYQGEEYFTTYKPIIKQSSVADNCYEFTQKTISNGAKVESGTFCRTTASQHRVTAEHMSNTAIMGEHHLKLEAWADNWFAAYIGEDLLIEDSVSITTERSFNAESIEFSANYPIHLNFIIKDFKQNDSGLEYIGARNQQMGDGGFIMQVTDTDTHKTVAVSNSSWQCEVLHHAPVDKSCEQQSNPIAGEGACAFIAKDAPVNWLKNDFDYSNWQNATAHSIAAVGPKDGYDEIDWDDSAQLIWANDLETDNTIICKTTIEQPKL